MGLRIRVVCVMAVICDHKRDTGLPGHPQKRLVHQLLILKPMVLHFQVEIPLSEDLAVGECRFLRLFVKTAYEEPGYLSRETGGGTDESLVVLTEYFPVHAGPVVEAFREAC